MQRCWFDAALWKMVIRPPRAKYAFSDLGPNKFYTCDREYKRQDVQLVNDKGLKLECSHFMPTELLLGERSPCVVYIHGNCSSRLEVLPSLCRLLQRDISVFCMDLSGSGWSDGDFISLGHFEQHDLRVAINYLRSCSFVSSIGLWGRSMGAVTAILRVSEDPTISACVLDSPFARLKTVAEELVANRKIILPAFLTNFFYEYVRGEVQTRAGFDIDHLSPIDKAPKVVTPVLFVVASEDTFVLPHHTEELCNAWGGKDRTVMQVSGSHNSARPVWLMDQAASFLENRLRRADENFQAPDEPTNLGSLAVRRLPLESIPVPRRVRLEDASDEKARSDNCVLSGVDWMLRHSPSELIELGREMDAGNRVTPGIAVL